MNLPPFNTKSYLVVDLMWKKHEEKVLESLLPLLLPLLMLMLQTVSVVVLSVRLINTTSFFGCSVAMSSRVCCALFMRSITSGLFLEIRGEGSREWNQSNHQSIDTDCWNRCAVNDKNKSVLFARRRSRQTAVLSPSSCVLLTPFAVRTVDYESLMNITSSQ